MEVRKFELRFTALLAMQFVGLADRYFCVIRKMISSDHLATFIAVDS